MYELHSLLLANNNDTIQQQNKSRVTSAQPGSMEIIVTVEQAQIMVIIMQTGTQSSLVPAP